MLCLWAIGIFGMGVGTGRKLQGILDRRRERRRRDEASHFEPFDTVTFGDRSYVVVASVAPRHGKETT